MAGGDTVPDAISILQAALDDAPVGVVLLSPDGALRWSNSTFRRWGGSSGAGPADGPGFRRDPLLGRSTLKDGLERALADGSTEGPVWSAEAIALPRASATTPAYVDASLTTVRSGVESPGARLLVLVDASERLRGREEARLHFQAFQTSTNAIEVTDRNGVLIDVNPAFEATYGYSRAECIGKRPNLVRSRHTGPEIYQRMWADLLDPQRGYWSGELVNRDRFGKEIPVFLTITAVRNDRGEPTHYVGVAVDLTEQKAWERAVAHSDRLASLGQLAAGVAHEINTPLANVLLVAESLRRRSPDPWTRGRAETITAQVDVAARIVRGLLDFARRSEPQTTRLDLAAVAHESVRFLRGKQSANVEVDERYPADPLEILGDRGQLMQVLTNLLLNAYDALENAASGHIVVEARAAGQFAEVEVRDSGPGIPVEALPHVFEPFFTTKPEGRGTGLGLAICLGIVQAHGGTIAARNLRDGGASLLVSLPLAPAAPPARSP